MYDQRRDNILALLEEKTSLTVKDLSDLLAVSEMTVRRDLLKMEKEGIVQRSFGGVSQAKGLILEQAIPMRAANMPNAKRRMAALAAGLIDDGDSVALDTGTTISELAKCVAKKNIFVVTSSIHVAIAASQGAATVRLSGGELNKTLFTLFGPAAEEHYKSLNYKYAFVGAAGISLTEGVTEFKEDAAALKRAILGQARIKALLADHTKFGEAKLFRAEALSAFDILITDKTPSKEYLDYFQENNIRVITTAAKQGG
ncbi:MAG: DeoR/GlpR family DNA-binding transcription regulator [Peptococcaceae bacterium]|jgi:DeoR/GlpR family transcriptional regulator of sugar metabolism|nr:DeoR/GlpR family DNA-binding transcription regulator [Peptococcaceae bacterium]